MMRCFRCFVAKAFSRNNGAHLTPNGIVCMTFGYKNILEKSTRCFASVPKLHPINGVNKIVLVASGKGGVGKSTVAVNLALGLQASDKTKSVGLLDADICGPSVPKMLNLKGPAEANEQNMMIPLSNYGIKCVSSGFLVEDDKKSFAWRGPMIMKALNILLRKVQWAPLDILIIDMPPGTSDVALSIKRDVLVDGAIIVTTPQDVALLDVNKGIQMLRDPGVQLIQIFGIVQNMAMFSCVKCGHVEHIFGKDGAKKLASDIGVDLLGDIPLHTTIMESCEAGVPVILSHPESPQARVYMDISEKVMKKLFDTK